MKVDVDDSIFENGNFPVYDMESGSYTQSDGDGLYQVVTTIYQEIFLDAYMTLQSSISGLVTQYDFSWTLSREYTKTSETSYNFDRAYDFG